jgi:lysophospholipase L1-like esterase
MIRFFNFCLIISLMLLPLQEIKAQSMQKFLALGDSYTIGEAVAERDRWPVQLVNKLRNAGVQIADPQIIATTGWTTDELQAAIAKENPEGTYQLVSLLIGVNNQYRSYPLETYKEEFEQLLNQALKFAGNKPERVVVVSIPDYGVTPFAADKNPSKIASELEAYNSAARQIAKSYQVPFFDITPASRLAENDPSLIASDGLHPSGKMYTHWAETVFPHVVKQLKNQ